jgi:hypothetical protein
MHGDHIGCRRNEPDRREVLARIIAEIVKQAGSGPQRRIRDQEDGVAVGRGFRRGPGGDRAAGARSIVDDDLLSQRFAHLVGDAARRRAGAAAGSERNDECDQTVRVALRDSRMRRQKRAGDENPSSQHQDWSGSQRALRMQSWHFGLSLQGSAVRGARHRPLERARRRRHGRACPGHPRLRRGTKTWMPGPRPGMTT